MTTCYELSIAQNVQEDEPMSAQTKSHSDTVAEDLELALRSATSIGRLWASYGLEVAKLALERNASTMQLTAQALGKISHALATRGAAEQAD